MDHACQGLCVTALWDMYKLHATGISNSLVVLLEHREVKEVEKLCKELKCCTSSWRGCCRLEWQEKRLSSCLQIPLHSEFVKTVLQVKKEVLSALG